MSTTEAENQTEKSLAKGLIAGLIGGLVATAARTLAERMFHPQPEPSLAAATPDGHTVALDTPTTALATTHADAIHWGFGAVAGAAYGALAEYYPAATAKEGASFGLALETLIHEGVPVLGLTPPSEDQSFLERAGDMSSHVLYGIVTETVRRIVRKML